MKKRTRYRSNFIFAALEIVPPERLKCRRIKMTILMRRTKPQDYQIGEPATFTAIVASPEAQAEFDELEKFKLSDEEPFRYEVLRHRKWRKEREEREKAQYGDRYQELLRIRAAVTSDVFEWIKPMAEDARARGFRFFQCDGDSDGLRLQFADGSGAYFQRSVSLRRFADKYGKSLDWEERSDISSAIHFKIVNLEGMESLGYAVKSKRVRAVRLKSA